MDKLINKVKADLTKGQKDTKVLLKADKKQDKKIVKAEKIIKAKPKTKVKAKKKA